MSDPGSGVTDREDWPALPLAAWRDTYATLHMWTQVVGKVRLALAPMVNHWWHVTLYLTTRGLTTSPMPSGRRTVQIDFDFIGHELRVSTSDGLTRTLALAPRPVADFYQDLMATLRSLGVEVAIWTTPVEVEERIPFEQDRSHAAYDPAYAHRCWCVLAQADRVLHDFRSRFLGKCSPVHFFWGAFDLAVTRFSGRRAPEHAGAPGLAAYVAREAYSHEVSSCGFWPGSGPVQEPAFYAYAYPEPPGFKDFPVRPGEAFYSDPLKEFILPYDAVRRADDPDAALLAFLQSTYEAAAELAHWDRAALERPAEATD
jgi:hypothetical protein